MLHEQLVPIRQGIRTPKVKKTTPNTHEPDNESTKILLTKSSMEYDMRSSIVEQSGSVASCFSFPDISCRAATKNMRLSNIVHGWPSSS